MAARCAWCHLTVATARLIYGANSDEHNRAIHAAAYHNHSGPR